MELDSKEKRIPFRSRKLSVFLAVFLWGAFACTADAASFLLNPSQGSYAVGSVIPVEIFVDTEGENINAVSGSLEYTEGVLVPTSIKLSDSLVNLWIERPSISEADGTVSFEGLILNPGFSGKGKIATINFEVLAPGVSTVGFVSGLALANDGLGTNVLARLPISSFDTQGSAGQTIARGQSELPIDPSTLVLDALRPPVVTGYTMRPDSIDDFSVQGVTYPNAQVALLLQGPENEAPEEHIIVADAAGNFSYRHDPSRPLQPLLAANALTALSSIVEGEQYRFWLRAIVNGATTPPTQAFEMLVGGIGLPEMLSAIIVLLVLGVGALLIFELVLLKRVYKERRKRRKTS